MPPAFVNIGAWIGEDAMIDSHVLVGSCAQIGARVHLAAGVLIGGVLEPPGGTPDVVRAADSVGEIVAACSNHRARGRSSSRTTRSWARAPRSSRASASASGR